MVSAGRASPGAAALTHAGCRSLVVNRVSDRILSISLYRISKKYKKEELIPFLTFDYPVRQGRPFQKRLTRRGKGVSTLNQGIISPLKSLL
jgi:hypothetical protein